MANRGSGREREEQEGGGSPSGFKGELSPINSWPFSQCHIGLWGNGSQLSLVPFSRQSRCYKIRWAPCCGAETPSQEAQGQKVPTCLSPTNEPLGWLTSRGNSPVHLYVQAIERASNSKLYRPKSAVEVKNNILMTMDIQSFILVLLQHKLHNVYVFTGLVNFCCYYKQHKKIQNYKILIFFPPSVSSSLLESCTLVSNKKNWNDQTNLAVKTRLRSDNSTQTQQENCGLHICYDAILFQWK